MGAGSGSVLGHSETNEGSGRERMEELDTALQRSKGQHSRVPGRQLCPTYLPGGPGGHLQRQLL